MEESRPPNAGLDQVKMAFLTPHFDRLLEIQREDRDKLRARAWQNIASVAAAMTFTGNFLIAHHSSLWKWVIVYLLALLARLAVLSYDLILTSLMPMEYRPPGEDPAMWLDQAGMLDQPIENVMAAHAVIVGKRVEENKKGLKAMAGNLHEFTAMAFRSFIHPAVLWAAGMAVLLELWWHLGR
jgi:hypothetical protein